MRALAQRLQAARPGWRITVWPDAGWEDAEVAVCWNTPAGLYARMPGLRLVHGIAAGVDNIMRELSAGTPVCRIIDARQVQGMVEYVLWSVLYFHRGFDQATQQQRSGKWARPPLRAAQDYRVGVAGLGVMGRAVAESLAARGYRVSGYSRTLRQVSGVECFAGSEQFEDFLARLDLLVCALPLTPATQGILSSAVFHAMPRGAALVHVGRGEQLQIRDLRAALSSGHLSGAVVDVFPEEPLAAGDPLWRTPGLVVTPHMATMASSESIIEQVARNVENLRSGAPLCHAVENAAQRSAAGLPCAQTA